MNLKYNLSIDSLHVTDSGELFFFSQGSLFNSSGDRLIKGPPSSDCVCVTGNVFTFVTPEGKVFTYTEQNGLEERENIFLPEHSGRYRIISGRPGFFCLQDLSDYKISLYNGNGIKCGPVITGTNSLYSELRSPSASARDGQGNILIADRNLCRICVFGSGGEPLGRIKRNQILPDDLFVDPKTGNILVLVRPGGTINPALVEIYSPDYSFLGYIASETRDVLNRVQQPLYASSHQHPHNRVPGVSVPGNRFCSLAAARREIYLGGKTGVLKLPYSIEEFAAGKNRGASLHRTQEHSVTIDGSGGFSVPAGGSADHINTEYAGRLRINVHISPPAFQPTEEIIITNEGDKIITNPWLRKADEPDWFSIDRLVETILPDGIDDREKARRLWRFMCRYTRFGVAQHNYYWDANKSVTQFFNTNGAGSCGTHPYFTALCRRSGLPAGDGFAPVLGHVLAKIRYEGKDHYFDDILSANEHDPAYEQGFSRSMTTCRRGSFPPALDNLTVASPEELLEDPYLLFRLNRLPHPVRRHLCYLRTVTKPNDWSPVTEEYADPADMGMNLRPGEQIIFRTCFMGKHLGTYWPTDNIVSGELRYIPSLGNPGDTGLFRQSENLEKIRTERGWTLQIVNDSEPGVLEIDVYCPWGITGGRIGGIFELSGGTVEIYIQPPGGSVKKIGSVTGDKVLEYSPCFDNIRELEHTGSFDPASGSLREGPPLQKYTARYVLTASGQGAIPLIHQLKIETDFQVNAVSIPMLRCGVNSYIYSQRSGNNSAVNIRFRWVESGIVAPPPKPRFPIFPGRGGEADTPEFRFLWEMPAGTTGEEIHDFEFFLSERRDFVYPLAPCFETFTGNGNPVLENPGPTFFNPGNTYYWKVRALGRNGIWGEWSDPWAFVYTGVGKPVIEGFTIEGETISISWKPGPGKLPVKYEVFGSNEQGFIPVSGSFNIAQAMESRETVLYPANKAGEVTGCTLPVAGPNRAGPGLNRVYYRIAAVDETEGRSCPSECIELPFPFVYSVPPDTVRPGEPFLYRIKALYRSSEAGYKGKIKTIMEYRTDTVKYSLVCGPDWISLDETTGILTGTPKKGKSGQVKISVRIETIRLMDRKTTGTCIHSFSIKMPDPF